MDRISSVVYIIKNIHHLILISILYEVIHIQEFYCNLFVIYNVGMHNWLKFIFLVQDFNTYFAKDLNLLHWCRYFKQLFLI